MEKYPLEKPLKSSFHQESLNLQAQVKLMQHLQACIREKQGTRRGLAQGQPPSTRMVCGPCPSPCHNTGLAEGGQQ